MTVVATTKGEGASAPSVPLLRNARAALLAAVRDGETHLQPVLDEVEDALIEAIARRRREAS